MVALYCRKNLGGDEILCYSCSSLLEYTIQKLASCPMLPDKPVCSKCTIHRYSPQQREVIRIVMRFSGPRMVLINPVVTLAYVMKKLKVSRKEPLVQSDRDRPVP